MTKAIQMHPKSQKKDKKIDEIFKDSIRMTTERTFKDFVDFFYSFSKTLDEFGPAYCGTVSNP
jgi:hypothetical protein